MIVVEDEVVTVVSVGIQGPSGPGLDSTDDLSEGDENLYFTYQRVTSNPAVQASTAARYTHAG